MTETPIVLTGPSGWIGKALIAHLFASEPAALSRLRLFGSAAGELGAPDGSRLPVRPLGGIEPADVAGALVVHLAYLTKEKADILGERRFFDTNLSIDEALLRAVRAGSPRAMFVASSGAASLAESGRDRHPYGIAKLLQEDRFLAYARSTGVPVLPGRIFNIAGPHINKLGSYAISSFLTQARERGVIAIDARVPVYRSYLHVDDLCALITRSLETGEAPDEPVDLCGTEIVEMGRLARLVADEIRLDRARITRGPVAFEKRSVYLGDPTRTDALALRFGLDLRPLAVQVRDTAEYLFRR